MILNHDLCPPGAPKAGALSPEWIGFLNRRWRERMSRAGMTPALTAAGKPRQDAQTREAA